VPRRNGPVVAARAAFLGGQIAETPAQPGLSHFHTAMWMRGTRSHSSAGYARAAEDLAAEIDGYSGRSSFGATVESPAEGWEPALELFVEPLLEPAFDAAELERERADTLAAIERREDRLGQRAFQLFAETHYDAHPYRQPLIGTEASVGGFDVDALAAHHARLVRAGNLVLAVAGDVDPDETAGRIANLLGDLSHEPFDAPAPAVEPRPTAVREAVVHKERAQAHLVIGFRGVTVQDDDRFELEVLAQLLAGQGGRLFLDLRDRRGLAYSVNAVNVEGYAPGYFAVYIATSPEKLDEARGGLLEALEALVQSPASADELDRAKRHLIGNHAIGRQRNSFHAAHTALDARYGLGADALHHFADRIQAVTAESALDTARRVLDLGAYTLAVVRP